MEMRAKLVPLQYVQMKEEGNFHEGGLRKDPGVEMMGKTPGNKIRDGKIVVVLLKDMRAQFIVPLELYVQIENEGGGKPGRPGPEVIQLFLYSSPLNKRGSVPPKDADKLQTGKTLIKLLL